MAQYVVIFMLVSLAVGSSFQNLNIPEMSVNTGKSRPPQECPIRSDLQFRRCLSPCQPSTCADVLREPRGGSRPCVRMCVSGWACPPGQYLMDGYTDVCVKKKTCKKLMKKRVTECTFKGDVIPINTIFLNGPETCRCFQDGQVRCRNAFPEA